MKLYTLIFLLSFSIVFTLASPGNAQGPTRGTNTAAVEKSIFAPYENPFSINNSLAIIDIPEPKPYTFYPNPARGNILHVDYESANGGMLSIRVLNMLGVATVDKKFDLTRGMNNLSLDISRLMKGLYLLEIIDSPNRYVEKLVVENE
jgi:hypothetical protein